MLAICEHLLCEVIPNSIRCEFQQKEKKKVFHVGALRRFQKLRIIFLDTSLRKTACFLYTQSKQYTELARRQNLPAHGSSLNRMWFPKATFRWNVWRWNMNATSMLIFNASLLRVHDKIWLQCHLSPEWLLFVKVFDDKVPTWHPNWLGTHGKFNGKWTNLNLPGNWGFKPY